MVPCARGPSGLSPTAHAHLAVDPGDREPQPFASEPFALRDYMLVDAVDSGAIEIKNEGRFH